MYKKYHDRGRYGTFQIPGDGNVGKLMIVKRHDAESDRFHTVTYSLEGNMLTLVKFEWAMRKFCHLDGEELADLPGRLKARPQKEVEEYFKSHPEADRFPHANLIMFAWNRGKKILEERITQAAEEFEQVIEDLFSDLDDDIDEEVAEDSSSGDDTDSGTSLFEGLLDATEEAIGDWLDSTDSD